jgi:beta-glucanase (GH16 family)
VRSLRSSQEATRRRRSSIPRRWCVVSIIAVLPVIGFHPRISGTDLAVGKHHAHHGHRSRLRLIFQSDFAGPQLNGAVWDTCYPWVVPSAGCTNFANPEYEWYLPSQVQLSKGALDLVAQQMPTEGQNSSGGPEEYQCRSGMVTTYPGFRFQYGEVKVVARLPFKAGLWSGLWLAAANLKFPPEIDMVEYWGRKTRSAGVYLHPYDGIRLTAYPPVANLSRGWHTFELDWTPTQLTWFIDGQVVLATNQQIPDQPMYFVADLAYSSTNPALIESGSGCNGILAIKSVQVWQSS